MKRLFFLTAIAVLLGVVSATAQQIAVVSEGGETSVFTTLQAAIEGADPGSVIYLPGGGFTISDDVKITKKLTIIGIGHRYDNDNVDGNTKILGNVWFNEGSNGSAIIGCYISGNVNIGENDATVNYILVKFCNLNSVQVINSTCSDILINQNYIRSTAQFNQSSAKISNNIIHSIYGVNNGIITNNLLRDYYGYDPNGHSQYATMHYVCIGANNSTISNNIIIPQDNYINDFYGPGYYKWMIFEGTENIISSNLLKLDLGNNPIIIGNVDWNDVFVNYNNGSIDPASDFHLKDAYKQYENVCGIYSGTGFNDHQTAPVPYIVAKRIAEETDAAGQLRIQVRVKAGE